MARVTRTELLEAMLYGLENLRGFTAPQLSDNYISGLTEVGKRRTPALIVSLANGQHFEVRAKALP